MVGVVGGPIAAVAVGTGVLFSRALIEAFNYYQHYGIVRVVGTPYDRRHLWNHLSPIGRIVAFEITNHADHHMDPYASYHDLVPHVAGPQMPSIFLCFLTGIVPPLWFRWIAMPRLKDWDLRFATPEERALAAEANRRAGWKDWIAEEAVRVA